MLPQPRRCLKGITGGNAIVVHEDEEEHAERSLLDSSAFISRGERLTDVQPDELLAELVKRRDKSDDPA